MSLIQQCYDFIHGDRNWRVTEIRMTPDEHKQYLEELAAMHPRGITRGSHIFNVPIRIVGPG